MSIKERLARAKANAEDRKSQREQEKRLSETIEAEERGKIDREKKIARLKVIEERARIKAREGGTLKRGFKALLAKAKEEERKTRKQRRKDGSIF